MAPKETRPCRGGDEAGLQDGGDLLRATFVEEAEISAAVALFDGFDAWLSMALSGRSRERTSV